MMTRRNTTWIPASLVLAIAGCTGDSTSLGTVNIREGTFASMGGALSVTQEECASEPKYCPYVGTSIVIPRGALTEPKKITISVGEAAEGRNGKPNGPALDFGPDGTAFASPVEITIPLTKEIEKDLLRVYVTEADGTKTVLMPNQLAYDRARKTVRFLARHFTTFQCGEANDACSDVSTCPSGVCQNGACTDPCDPDDCGPQPGIPAWTCDDGTVGGFTGQCVRRADGSCGWDIRDCSDPDPCGVNCPPGSSCDPATGQCVTQCVCPDGAPCAVDQNGTVYCGGTGCENGCPPGSSCDPATGQCVNGCVCPDGQSCSSDPSTPPSCSNSCDNTVTCPPGSSCDPATGTCTPDCVCPDGQPCAIGANGTVWCGDPNDCSAGCPPGTTCDPNTGNCTSDCVCPDGQSCVFDPNGTVSCGGSGDCDPNECGPAPGLPNWTCDDGSTGGPTGQCVRGPDGSCGWEINWCPMGCAEDACNGQPPPPNTTCSDGTIPPYVCRHDANNVCSWTQSCGSNPGGN